LEVVLFTIVAAGTKTM